MRLTFFLGLSWASGWPESIECVKRETLAIVHEYSEREGEREGGREGECCVKELHHAAHAREPRLDEQDVVSSILHCASAVSGFQVFIALDSLSLDPSPASTQRTVHA